ncbi:hypothetical protein MSAN_00131700 [Mycena sanguinolenta]|uniref:Uncharacterized protein n=1 Tax=Mycena sanguinolenta TaxID=230812 RepID=A0A8H7DKU9_9AGAR|nr:hypothetical protein MSAN_00131700 [Mycena sanguinolenta]
MHVRRHCREAVSDRVPIEEHVPRPAPETHAAVLLDEEVKGGYIRCCGRAASAADVYISFCILHLTPLRPVLIRPPFTLDDHLPRALTRSLEPTRHTPSATLLALSSSKTKFHPSRSFAPSASGPVASCARRRAYPALYLSRQPNSYLGGRVHTCRCLDAGDKEGSGAEWSEENVSDAAAGVEPVETLLSRSHGHTFGNNDGPHPRRSAVESNSVPAAQACFRFAVYGWRAVLRIAAQARASRRFRIPLRVGRPSKVRFAGSELDDAGGRWSSSAAEVHVLFHENPRGRRAVRGILRFVSTELHPVLTADADVDAGIDFLRASLPRFASHLSRATLIHTPLRGRSSSLALADFACPPRSLVRRHSTTTSTPRHTPIFRSTPCAHSLTPLSARD